MVILVSHRVRSDRHTVVEKIPQQEVSHRVRSDRHIVEKIPQSEVVSHRVRSDRRKIIEAFIINRRIGDLAGLYFEFSLMFWVSYGYLCWKSS